VKGNFLTLMRAVARGLPLPLASIANKRSLLYVGNLADAVLRCIDAPAAQGSSFLVSDGIPVSTPGLCRALGAALGKPARLLPFPPRLLPSRRLTGSLVVDDRAIRRELAWTPPVPFEEGLRRTAQWFLTQGG
jgi:nucleoside-diphosphate-sugar epimerase